MTAKYAFFKGCFIPYRAPHLEYVTWKIMPELGIEMEEVSGFTCCPEPVGFSLHEKKTWLTIAARNLSLAEEQDKDIVTVCNGCFYTLEHTMEELENDELRDEVNQVLAETDHEYRGKTHVKHFIQVLKEDVGMDRIRQAVKFPLKGLRVATHTGCHYSNRFGKESRLLDEMVNLLGCTSVDYEMKNLCCGWMKAGYGEAEEGYEWIKQRLENMKEAESDCIAVICPQCYQQYDTGQLLASRKADIPFKIPVLFYLQLLGLAMGYSIEEMQLRAHRIKDGALESKLQKILSIPPN
jgi:heterodisulfide reductase subunit B